MATGEVRQMDDGAARRWAQLVYAGAADGSSPDVRTAVVTELVEADWSPPPHRRTAVEAALADEAAAMPTRRAVALSYLAAEGSLRPTVEEFAQRLFRTPVAERVKEWHALWSRTAEFPALQARLNRLRPALAVAAPAMGDPELQPLVEIALEWIVARPGGRGELRARIDRALTAEREERYRRVAVFRLRYPELAQLAPSMFDNLPTPARDFKSPVRHAPWRELPNEVVYSKSTRTPVYQSETAYWSRAGWVVICLILLVSFAARSGTKSPRYTPPPRIQMPNFNSPEWKAAQDDPTLGPALRKLYGRPLTTDRSSPSRESGVPNSVPPTNVPQQPVVPNPRPLSPSQPGGAPRSPSSVPR